MLLTSGLLFSIAKLNLLLFYKTLFSENVFLKICKIFNVCVSDL